MIMAKSDVAVRVIGGGAALMAGSVGLAQAQDVGGFYGGLGVGANGGDFLAFGSDEYSFSGGPGGSLFAGYNVVSGNLVYGGEISWMNGAESSDNIPYIGKIDSLIDLKGRVGTMVGSTLFYGSLGYSVGDVSQDWSGAGGGDVSGFNLGAGFETAISDKMFIGGDFTMRNLDAGGSIDGVPTEEYMDDVNLSTVSIRMGFRF
jgi:outer membrane immunogenic protein